MRIPRVSFLPQSGGLVHKFWRAHNREFLLKSDAIKVLYLKKLFAALKHSSVKSEVEIHAYCIMSNHAHVLARYRSVSEMLSTFMRIAHSHFGQTFNRLHKRQGAVAYDRPKTPLVQESLWNIMRVHFYIEANPLRAGMVKNLKLYQFSSFAFYAWGVKSEFSSSLTVPAWYLGLGRTNEVRQSRYRSLFQQYLSEIVLKIPGFTKTRFIGDTLWVHLAEEHLSLVLAKLKPDRGPLLS